MNFKTLLRNQSSYLVRLPVIAALLLLGLAAAYLDACADRTGADWHLLRAKVYMKQGEYASAAVLLQQEEKKKPEETVPLLEICFREMGDFQHAYYYACLQRK